MPLNCSRFFGAETISYFLNENPDVKLDMKPTIFTTIQSVFEDLDCEIALTAVTLHNGIFYPDTYNITNPMTGIILYATPKSDYTFVPCTSTKFALECHKDLALQHNSFSFANLDKKLLINMLPENYIDSPLDLYIREKFPNIIIQFEPESQLYYKMLEKKFGYGLTNHQESNSKYLPDTLTRVSLKDDFTILYGYLEKNSNHSPVIQYFTDLLKKYH